MGNILIIFFVTLIILTTLLYSSYQILNKNDKLEFFIIPFSLYLISLISFNYFVTYRNITEYKSFNNLDIKDVEIIYINKKNIVKDGMIILFNELKNDQFSWVNHPVIINSDTILVKTKSRDFKFIIQNTSNQGVLIMRINKEEKDYVINRNDNLFKLIEDYNR